jgi:hypothetical protein
MVAGAYHSNFSAQFFLWIFPLCKTMKWR